MAVEIPDIRNLRKWDDAFQYPIPTTRAIEKRLKNGLTENQDKVRTLVGASYRDLLGTARTIIDIDEQLHKVEELTRDTSLRTDSRHFQRLRSNATRLNNGQLAHDHERYALTSQKSTLRASLDLTVNILKSSGSSLLAAKLLILSRILLKPLAAQTDQHLQLAKFKSRLSNLRRILLREIDKRFERTGLEVNDVVEDLAAFCLATSSGPSDAFRHFLTHRGRIIQRSNEGVEENVRECVQGRLDLFTDTVKQCKSIFPDLLAASLRRLGSRSVLEDPTIRHLEKLELELHLRWLGEDIQNYTPWTRHHELQDGESGQQLTSWSTAALDALASKIEEDLRGSSNQDNAIDTIMSARKDILQTWLSTRNSIRGLNVRDALPVLRNAFSQRCLKLASAASHDIKASMTELLMKMMASDESDVINERKRYLWDTSFDPNTLADGGSAFREEMVGRRIGATHQLMAIITSYEMCFNRLKAIHTAFKAMRETRWDDDYEDSDNEDSQSNETGSTIANALSRDDPDALLKKLQSETAQAIADLELSLSRYTDLPPSSGGVFFLRLLRELRSRLPLLYATLDCPVPTHLFAHESVGQLQRSLAEHVVSAVFPAHNSYPEKMSAALPIRLLWEGSPPLPVQIHPAAFKFLCSLVKEMEKLGVDLWNPEAVQELKQQISVAIVELTERTVSQTVEECGVGFLENVDESADSSGQAEQAELQDGEANSDGKNTNSISIEKSDEDDATPTAGDSAQDPPTPSDVETGDDQTVTGPVSQPADTKVPAQPSQSRKLPVDNIIQLLFDTYYLQHALTPTPSSQQQTSGTVDQAFTRLIDKLSSWCQIEEAERARLQKNARDYWRRTYLLFGLLCNG